MPEKLEHSRKVQVEAAHKDEKADLERLHYESALAIERMENLIAEFKAIGIQKKSKKGQPKQI